MANPIIVGMSGSGGAVTATIPVDPAANPFSLSYAVELAAGATGSFSVFYSLDDPNDATWTPVWFSDLTLGAAQTASVSGGYSRPIRQLRVAFTALTGSARVIVLQGLSPL